MLKKTPFAFLFSIVVLVSCSDGDSLESEITSPEFAEELDLIISSDLKLNRSGYAPLSAELKLITEEDVDVVLTVVEHPPVPTVNGGTKFGSSHFQFMTVQFIKKEIYDVISSPEFLREYNLIRNNKLADEYYVKIPRKI